VPKYTEYNCSSLCVQVFLASCSHRTFMSKMEVAYKAMQLPLATASFPDVEVQGCYWRATLTQSSADPSTVVYSDRTKYSAYAERHECTVLRRNVSEEELNAMSFREFCERVTCNYRRSRVADSSNTQLTKKRKLKSCVRGSGRWVMSLRKVRAHVRFSTTLYTDLAGNYVGVSAASVITTANCPCPLLRE
jgi:hypothetical protein